MDGVRLHGQAGRVNLHLVDGTYELFRAHFGAPSASSPSGQEVGATRGLLRSLYSLLRQDGVSHVAVAFDTVVESFRNDLFDGYKTGEGMEEELHAQFPLAERAAHALGLEVWPMREFEADDALCTGAARWAASPEVETIFLCSPDKDLGQCVRGKKVVMLDRRKRVVIDEAGVTEKYGVPPASIPDLLALVGDSADGIPGVPKWGMKSTSTVLGVYGHVDAIPADPEGWSVKVRGAKGLSASLEGMREEAALYRKLAVLRDDVPLRSTLEDLEWRGARREELAALCGEIGDGRFLGQVTRWR